MSHHTLSPLDRAERFDPLFHGRRGRDRDRPDVFETMLADPVLPVDKEALELAVRDLRRWPRRYLRPPLRVISRLSLFSIVAVKRLFPLQFRSHRLLDFLCVGFLRHFVSEEAACGILRHFIIETQLINFVIRNCGANDIRRAELLPKGLGELGEGAVMKHDAGIYNLFLDLGASERASVLDPRPVESLDFAELEVPSLDPEPGRFRLLRLDIESALYVMSIFFCLLTTEEEYERAVNSFQLDESLMACIANLTGDLVFRSWTPLRFTPWLAIHRDVARDLYWHALVHEYAHGRLRQMRDRLKSAAVHERGM